MSSSNTYCIFTSHRARCKFSCSWLHKTCTILRLIHHVALLKLHTDLVTLSNPHCIKYLSSSTFFRTPNSSKRQYANVMRMQRTHANNLHAWERFLRCSWSLINILSCSITYFDRCWICVACEDKYYTKFQELLDRDNTQTEHRMFSETAKLQMSLAYLACDQMFAIIDIPVYIFNTSEVSGVIML